MRKLFVVGLALFSLSANAAIIDFDSESVGSVSSPFVVGDFTFFGSGLEIISQGGGDNALYSEAFGPVDEFGNAGPFFISMSSTSGDPFAFYGADLVGGSANGSVFAGFEGIVSGGGFAAGPIGTGDWLNLESIRFSVGSLVEFPTYMFDTLSVTVDNINATVVPIPAAVWLFSSALAGLGWFRRKAI